MGNVSEAAGLSGEMEGPLFEGLNQLARNQEVVFTQYTKFILPVDGYVFWFRSGSIKRMGAVHYASTRTQKPDETIGVNRIIFTSEGEITEFNLQQPNIIWVGEFQGFKFSFAERREFFEQSGLHHYLGQSIWPIMLAQLIDNLAQFDQVSQIVSNSMPVWLSLNNYAMPPYYPWSAFPTIYPAFLVPENTPPPYISAYILPEKTEAIQSVPMYYSNYSHNQLVTDTVTFFLHGFRNQQAMDFQDFLFQYSLDTDNFGLMNMPVMVDQQREQVEISALAQKKTFTMQVSYYQTRVNNIARQLILEASSVFTFEDYTYF